MWNEMRFILFLGQDCSAAAFSAAVFSGLVATIVSGSTLGNH
jgi:hypothetical protein